jgi:protein kinase-like protein
VGRPPVLAGRYALVAPLGRGGMGQVWEGRDERLSRPVAVKLLTAEVLAGQPKPESLVLRFRREAAVTAGLAHPGVPAIHDAGEYDGGLFLVMELVQGCTVGDLIAEHGPLPVPWVSAIGAQVASVLAAAHDRGIIHRDIKPQNIMLTPDGAAKVLDFGIAGVLGQRITSTGAAVGTLAYMAPEQLNNLPATPRTDLYALGCLLYEMLAGQPVFAAASPAGLMRLHLDVAPQPLHRADLPPVLDGLVRQLLEKDPGRRPPDAREIVDRLMPYVVPPGSLGDINPAAGQPAGMAVYSLLMAQLRGAVAAAGSASPLAASRARSGRRVPGSAAGSGRRVPGSAARSGRRLPAHRRECAGYCLAGVTANRTQPRPRLDVPAQPVAGTHVPVRAGHLAVVRLHRGPAPPAVVGHRGRRLPGAGGHGVRAGRYRAGQRQRPASGSGRRGTVDGAGDLAGRHRSWTVGELQRAARPAEVHVMGSSRRL